MEINEKTRIPLILVVGIVGVTITITTLIIGIKYKVDSVGSKVDEISTRVASIEDVLLKRQLSLTK
jgi:hypothetical protein